MVERKYSHIVLIPIIFLVIFTKSVYFLIIIWLDYCETNIVCISFSYLFAVAEILRYAHNNCFITRSNGYRMEKSNLLLNSDRENAIIIMIIITIYKYILCTMQTIGQSVLFVKYWWTIGSWNTFYFFLNNGSYTIISAFNMHYQLIYFNWNISQFNFAVSNLKKKAKS